MALEGEYPQVPWVDDWYLTLRDDAGLRFTELPGEYYVAYCVNDSGADHAYALLIESDSGNYYRANGSSVSAYEGSTHDWTDFCESVGFTPGEYDGAWIKGLSGWAGGQAW